jgi:hypothetical protein
MIRKLATAGRVIGIATLLIAPFSVGALAAGSSTGTGTTTSKDCSTYSKNTKAYRDCMAGKSSGGNTSGGSTRTTPGH